MNPRIVSVAAGAWIVSAIICGFGYVEVFAPMTVVLLGFVLAFDRSAPDDRLGPFMATAVAAGAIWLGLQQQDRRQEQIAYWAYREMIGCKAADRWESFGMQPDFPEPKPPESELHRCSALNDGADFKSILRDQGW